jgi:hypothetical protein
MRVSQTWEGLALDLDDPRVAWPCELGDRRDPAVRRGQHLRATPPKPDLPFHLSQAICYISTNTVVY